MSDTANNTTLIWLSLLTACDGQVADLSDADPTAQECAEQMRDADILTEPSPGCFTLSSNGSRLLLLIERLRDYSLGIN